MRFRVVKNGNGKYLIQKRFLWLFWFYYEEPVFEEYSDLGLLYVGSDRHVYQTLSDAFSTIRDISLARTVGPFYRGHRVTVGWENWAMDRRVFVKTLKFFGKGQPCLNNFVYYSDTWEGLKEQLDGIEEERKRKKLGKNITWASEEIKV